MSEPSGKFKVTLEFDVEINPISVPDEATLEKLLAPAPVKSKKAVDLRAGMKLKGMSDADIEKVLAESKVKSKAQARNYQMLLYPEYENSVAAQRALQAEILQDPELSAAYVQEMVRDTTRGRLETLLEDKHGECDLAGVLRRAMGRLSPEHQALLKSDQESLVHDETELVDDSVSVRFAQVVVVRSD